MTKRIISIVLAVLLAFLSVSLVGCGKKNVLDEKAAKDALTTKSLTNIYKAENISVFDTPLEKVEINSITSIDENTLLVMGMDLENYETAAFISDLDFKNITEFPFKTNDYGENGSSDVTNVFADEKNQNIWYLLCDYIYNGGGDFFTNDIVMLPEISVSTSSSFMPSGRGFYRDNNMLYTLIKADLSGNVLNEINLSEHLMIEKPGQEGYMGYVQDVVISDNTVSVLVGGEKIVNFDLLTGELKSSCYVEIDSGMGMFFVDKNGDFMCTYWAEEMELAKIDPETGKVTPVSASIKERLYNYTIKKGELGYDLILSNYEGIYGYNYSDDEPTEICNYATSDIEISYSPNPEILKDGRILVSNYNYEDQSNDIFILTKLATEEIKEKYIIKVAGIYLDSNVKSELIKFNRTSEDYKVIFKTYDIYNNSSNEYTGGAEKLMQDIISKDAPDIVIYGDYDGIDYASLSSKGAFVDINAFIDADAEFNRADYLENILEAFEENGKLYRISPSVNFMTLVGKAENFGGKTFWTMADFINMSKSLGENETMFAEPTRVGIGTTFLNIATEQFIEESGKCNFDSQEFKDMLEYLKSLPEDYSEYETLWQENQNYWQELEAGYSKGTVKLEQLYIHSFGQIPESEARFGSDVTFIGYPTNTQNAGTVIAPNNFICITSNSKVKAGAWEALKHLLSEESQSKYAGDRKEDGSGSGSYTFPINKKIVERKMKNDLLPRYFTYYDENGELVKEEYGNTMWIGDQEVEMRKSTEADAQTIYDLISSAKVLYTTNEELIDIIMQDASGFFDGQKTVDEVAQIINSRIQIYVGEHM